MSNNKEFDHYLALKKIRTRITKTNKDFLRQKKRIIIDQIDQSSQKSYNSDDRPSKEDIINSKILILMLIFSKKFENNKDNQ
jgi:hypothetical protein